MCVLFVSVTYILLPNVYQTFVWRRL